MLQLVLLCATAASLVPTAQADNSESDTECLLQAKALGVDGARVHQTGTSIHMQRSRTSISKDELVTAEAQFTATATIEASHGNVGGDRMSKRHHNYAPIYAKYMTPFLQAADVPVAPTVAEVGILTGTGLAMWSKLFPQSQIFGFDLNTSSYQNNIHHMRSFGFEDNKVRVTQMNQMDDNKELLQSVFHGLQAPSLVVDDGYHIPEAGKRTFLSMKPFLAHRFVYFIEDLTKTDIDAGLWEPVKDEVLEECPGCKFAIECPPVSDKHECVAVIHSLEDNDKLNNQPADSLTLEEWDGPADMLEVDNHFLAIQAPEPAEYDTLEISLITEEQPLVNCSPEKKTKTHHLEAELNLQQAVSIYCDAGLGAMVEFSVDPRFKGNYERLKGPDGWIEKAFVSYMGLHKAQDNTSAQMGLLVQSVHRFSNHPIVVTSFGRRVPKYLTPERFPNLVLMHAHESATDIKKGFNLNKLNSMLFTKVKGGMVVDADQWLAGGVDVMMERVFQETTKQYPYPILPVHFLSKDPESDDMDKYDPGWTFPGFVSKAAPKKRTMRWGHAHPTWTHHALPWLAKWTSYLLAPEETNAPAWLQEQGLAMHRRFVSDEPLLNFASWADGLTKQWCKFDIPRLEYFALYLEQTRYPRVISNDKKYYPKGIPYMFVTSHAAKNVPESYNWLSKLWQSGNDGRKRIHYDGRWFDSGKALNQYDPSLKCIL